MKFFLSMLVLLFIFVDAFSCQGSEVDSCEAVLSPSMESCRSKYEVLYDMQTNTTSGAPKSSRAMHCGYSGLHCVRMGSLCTQTHF